MRTGSCLLHPGGARPSASISDHGGIGLRRKRTAANGCTDSRSGMRSSADKRLCRQAPDGRILALIIGLPRIFTELDDKLTIPATRGVLGVDDMLPHISRQRRSSCLHLKRCTGKELVPLRAGLRTIRYGTRPIASLGNRQKVAMAQKLLKGGLQAEGRRSYTCPFKCINPSLTGAKLGIQGFAPMCHSVWLSNKRSKYE